MNLFSFKKTIILAGILSVAIYAQQAFAWGYLYCTPDQWSTKDWEWAKLSNPEGTVDNFTDLAYGYTGWDGVRYVVIKGPERMQTDNGTYWSLNVPARSPLMKAEEATAFCQKLKSFCPAGKPYVGASQTEYGQVHRIWVPKQASPEKPNEGVYDVCW